MKLVTQFLCALLVASAAAQAQSVPTAPYKSVSGSKSAGFTSDEASATATVAGEIGGGLQVARKGAPDRIVAEGGARASADVTLFGKRVRVAGVDAAARSELNGSVASASISVKRTMCDFTLEQSDAQGAVSLPTVHWEVIVCKAQTTFSFFGIPITVKGSFGAGMDNSLTARAWSPGGRARATLAVGIEGSAAIYALVQIRVEVSIGIGGAGVGGDGQILRTELRAGLGAASDGAAGYLKLVVTPLRLRIYVYAWIDLPFRDRDEARKYIADLSVGGATYDLINF